MAACEHTRTVDPLHRRRQDGPSHGLRLLAAGFPVAVADVVPAALAAFNAGVPRGTVPGELDGDLVVTMLPTDAEVDAALFAAGGALARPRRTVIDMSSSAPAGTRRIAARLAERGSASSTRR